jgi:predicted TIM-barrel fold metal-dependent hydrolase
MITGFNPADMYAADHIRRVLRTYPGVFSGIGEFTIHKEFVSSKVAGEIASLTDPALDRIFDFAAEAGLVVLIHNDMDVPFAKAEHGAAYFDQMAALLERHPRTTVIWAHVGLGRVVHPVQTGGTTGAAERSPDHVAILQQLLGDPELTNLYFDISWDEVAKYLVATPESTARAAAIINRYPDRFLFGTDNVAPQSSDAYFAIYRQYAPLWAALTPEASRLVRLGNYQRLFDAARVRVREWERLDSMKGDE